MPVDESMRISTAMSGGEALVSVGVASGVFATSSNARRKLICTPPIAGQRYSISKQTAVLDQGVTVNGGGPPVVIDDEQYGDWCKSALNAIGSAAVSVIQVAVVRL